MDSVRVRVDRNILGGIPSPGRRSQQSGSRDDRERPRPADDTSLGRDPDREREEGSSTSGVGHLRTELDAGLEGERRIFVTVLPHREGGGEDV